MLLCCESPEMFNGLYEAKMMNVHLLVDSFFNHTFYPAVPPMNSRGRWGTVNTTQNYVLALAVASCLHRRRHSERRWRPEGGFRLLRREVVAEQWDLDHRYRAQDQAWAPGLLLEGWDRRRPRRTTCIAPRCPGLGTR